MKKRIAFQMIAGLCAIMFACTALTVAQDVRYNHLPGTDFSKYKTYKWVEVPGGSQADQIVSAQITQAIDSQLAAKGLAKTDSEQADLYVAYQLAVNQEKQWDAIGYGGRYTRMGGTGTMTSSTINIGTLVVDMYDVASKKQVWHGDATKTMNPSKDPQKNQEKIQKAVAKLLKNYPPPVKK
jgi:hypothetical protein